MFNIKRNKAMKKNCKTKTFCRLSVMCISLLCCILIFGITSVFTTSSAYGQKTTPRISVKLENVSVLEALREINRLSGNEVVYKKEEVEKETKKVSVTLNNVTVLSAVAACLTDTKLSCVMSDGKVVVVPEKEQKALVVTGVIKDKAGAPLPGATIVVKGSSVGTSTGVNGEYKIVLPSSAKTLIYSFIGYKSEEVEVNGRQKIDVILEDDVKKMDEVVVVAYGTQNKRDVVGAMSTVTAEEIKDIPSPSLANLLQGRVAGMSVINMTGVSRGRWNLSFYSRV